MIWSLDSICQHTISAQYLECPSVWNPKGFYTVKQSAKVRVGLEGVGREGGGAGGGVSFFPKWKKTNCEK